MFLALSSRKNKKKGRCSLKWAVCVPERLKKLYLKESKSEIINQKKGRSLSTVIIVRLEEDGKIVVTWLASDFFDSFQLFVFVQVHSINRRILPFKVINGPADVNSGSRTCGLKTRIIFLKLCFKPSKIRRFCSILRLSAPRFQFVRCHFPNRIRRAAASLHFQVRQGCGPKFSWKSKNLEK